MGKSGGGAAAGPGATSGPAPGVPGAGAAPGAVARTPTSGARGGIPLDFRRGKSASKLLEIEWLYPVWKPAPTQGPRPGTTAAVEVEHALTVEQAFAWVADGDRRPLLVLRECELCKGTDHALLSRTLDNEQTVLLTHWFRCVKLPTNVLTPQHPFYNLFARPDGEHVPHLFFADADGGNRRELPGDQSQQLLWETMFSYLERCYAEDAHLAIKELRQLLSQYDKIDAQEQDVKTRIDTEVEKNGLTPRVRKLEADLQKIAKERDELRKREAQLRDLALKRTNAPAAGQQAGTR